MQNPSLVEDYRLLDTLWDSKSPLKVIAFAWCHLLVLPQNLTHHFFIHMGLLINTKCMKDLSTI
ncbi:hypothetical protein Lalb_Chr08g0240631 [Lupinus albus]|uniref:Uncharacterized protein n=1 Tax=Lupinus albus TaxID=3870 RepID=A0A6A4Q436_LUPAL|nr:hypothetical protein Lalb_Chr08g0240631 [Lupinus albus]